MNLTLREFAENFAKNRNMTDTLNLVRTLQIVWDMVASEYF
jgi:hypothetical protein